MEPLEPRVLLSADPVAAAMPAIVMDDRDRPATPPGFHNFESESIDGTASFIVVEPGVAPGAPPSTSLESIDPSLRVGALDPVAAPERLSQAPDAPAASNPDDRVVLGPALISAADSASPAGNQTNLEGAALPELTPPLALCDPFKIGRAHV